MSEKKKECIIIEFDKIEVAESFGKRLFGLMGKRNLPQGYALVFPRTKSVHTCFMRTPISVIYLDGNDMKIGDEMLAPWRLGHAPKGTKTVVETSVETIRGKTSADTLKYPEMVKIDWRKKIDQTVENAIANARKKGW